MNFLKIVFFFFGITFISAQQYTLGGEVIDFHNKTPLANATIQMGEHKTTSDSQGKFSLSKIPKGLQTIVVQHKDCETYTQELDINENLSLKITLEHHITEIETVTLHRKHKDNGSLIISTLGTKEISRNSTENLGNLLSNNSGVSTLKTGNNIAKPIIHGLYGDRITIMNNGVKLADQEWGVEHAPNIDANNFEHIDVIKGASTLKYGTQTSGGVIVLEPEIFPKKDTLKGLAKLSAISNGKGVAQEINLTKTWENNWAIKTRGAYTKLGDLETPDYGLMNTGMEQNSFGFSIQKNTFLQGISFDYYLTQQKLGIFRGSDLGNLNDFYDAITAQKPIYTRDFSYNIDNPHQDIQHHIAKIAAFKRFENWGKISADYSFQYNNRKEYDVRRGDLYNIPAMQLELLTNQLNVTQFLEREKWSLETGLQGQYQYNYSPISTQAKRLIPNYSQYNTGVFSIFKYNLSQQWKTEIGIRYDYQKYLVKAWFDAQDWQEKYEQDYSSFFVKNEDNRVFTKPQFSYHLFGFNAGINYAITTNHQIKLNYSNTKRAPNIAELFAGGLHHSAAMIEVGDMRLSTENTQQIQLEWESKFDIFNGLKINISPYYSSIQNFITQIPTGVQNTIRGVFPVWTYQPIQAKMIGVDADANLKINNTFQLSSHFSYLNGQDKTHLQPLILMMPTQWTQAIEANFPWKKSYLKLEHIGVAHQNKFPVYNPNIFIYENGVEVEKNLDLSTPPPAYQLWNIYAEIEPIKQFTVGLKINNLLNTSYKNYLNRMRYFSNEMGRNITLSLQYKF